MKNDSDVVKIATEQNIIPNAPESESNITLTTREQMTRYITYHIAAGFIADKDFPRKENLPDLIPPPFHSFGHQLLFDYKLLVRIIWKVIEDIQATLYNTPKHDREDLVKGFGGVFAGVLILFLSSWILKSDYYIGLLAFGISLLALGVGGSIVLKSKFKNVSSHDKEWTIWYSMGAFASIAILFASFLNTESSFFVVLLGLLGLLVFGASGFVILAGKPINVSEHSTEWKIWSFVGVLAGIAILLISFQIMAKNFSIGVLTLGISLQVLGAAFFLGTGDPGRKELKKSIAKIRANAIEQLVQGRWEPIQDNLSKKKFSQELNLVGNGKIGGDKIPVLTVLDNKHPFPGYGPMQAENLFICRPKERNTDNFAHPSVMKIQEVISKNIAALVSGYEIESVSSGNVVVLHGDSLSIDSKWLNRHKVPILWLEKEKLSSAESIDEKASLRIYFAVQILFPQYMTSATFFVRPFMAGNSASCQIAVTTIGPSLYSFDYFQRRLLKYRKELEADTEELEKEEQIFSRTLSKLRFARAMSLAGSSFQSNLKISAIKKLHGRDERNEKNYWKAFRRTIKDSVAWPGHFTAKQNFREAHSLTFTNDFFGRTEAVASVKTLYDQVGRAVIDSFDILGFDVSNYKDSEGTYSINAEKIDQLVVGERIKLVQDSSEKGKGKNNKDHDE